LVLAGCLLVVAMPRIVGAPGTTSPPRVTVDGGGGLARPTNVAEDPGDERELDNRPRLRADRTLTRRLTPQEGEEVPFREGEFFTRAPGSDTPFCASWEPTVATDALNPETVVVAQFRTAQISFDGGNMFTQTLTGATPALCDDGTTPCNFNSDCNGIGTGTCNTGLCSNNANILCNVNSDCGAMNTCNGMTGGDPSVAFDSQNRMFITYLCRAPGARDVCIAGYQLNGAGTQYNAIPGVIWPVRVTVAAGRPGQNNDKQWLASDWYVGSPYTDRLHMVWVDLGGPNGFEIYASFSDDQGVNWSPAANISPTDGSDGTVWPPHLTVAPNGDLYVTYHSQTGFQGVSGAPDGMTGQTVLVRSPDGGTTFSICDDGTACTQTSDCNGIGTGTCNGRSTPFPMSFADTTFNVQHLRYCDDGTTQCSANANCMGIGSGTCNAPLGAIPGARFWTFGTVQAWVLADPDMPGRIYVVTNDDPDDNPNSGDPADVVIARSDDFGVTWPFTNQVDDGAAGTFQLLPTAAIDPVTGAIGVTWYDNRSGATNGFGNFLLDLRASYSYDSGASWTPSIDVNDGQYDPDTSDSCRFCSFGGPTNVSCATGCPLGSATTTNRIGEYNGIAFGECTAHMAWADNLASGCGGDTSTWYDRDPEGGGDLVDPMVSCPSDVEISCTESTSPSNTGSASATDNCTVEPDVGSVDDVTPGDCPQEMTISRIWNATDNAGNIDTCEQIIEVVDDGDPVVTAPAPLGLECNAPGGVAGDDPQILSWLGMASAMDDCGNVTLTDNAPDFFPASCPPGTPIDVTFTGTDECGNSGQDGSSVTVLDETDPEVMCSVGDVELWPPHHDLVDAGFEYSVVEVCDPDPTVVITVTSDEHPEFECGAGGTIHCPDAVVDGDTVLLRRERSGGGDGRIYTITVTVTDDCGNQGSCQATVGVPQSMNPHIDPIDSGQLYDPTVCTGG
jgi:hypothetical protein